MADELIIPVAVEEPVHGCTQEEPEVSLHISTDGKVRMISEAAVEKEVLDLERVQPGTKQLSYDEYKQTLEKAGYRFLGQHSAVKICEWTKKSMTGKGSCYKQRFYGIQSHRCAQISVSVNFCDKDCVYCWRSRNNSAYTSVDDPAQVLDNVQHMQDKLLDGFGGNSLTNEEKFLESKDVQHFAISLTGETLSYPRLNDLIREIKKRGKTSFVVTHGGFPQALEKIEPPTQLYLSIDAPNEELFNKVDRPLAKDGWQRLLQSLDAMKKLKEKTRTILRVTVVQGVNMIDPAGYAALVQRADPMCVEVKAFMLIGAARNRLRVGNMPSHEEVRAFAVELAQHAGYKIIDDAPESRVVLMMKEDVPGRVMQF